MSYIINQTRAASLKIGGVDYTEVLLDWSVSDSTANKNGCVRTQGSVILGWKPGSSVVEDYDRTAEDDAFLGIDTMKTEDY